MTLDFIDKTGAAPSTKDVDEANRVIAKYVVTGMLTLPPELAVQLPNILRCLSYLRERLG